MKLSLRLLLSMVSLVIISAGAVGWVVYSNMAPEIVASDSRNAQDSASQIAGSFTRQVNRAVADVIALRSLPTVRHIATQQSRSTAEKSRLEDLRRELGEQFAAQIIAKPSYLQIRLIGVDSNGRELVRVDKDDALGGARIVPEDELQEKGGRDYFEESISLPPGEIYFSRLDLNREHGVIQTPYVPVMRIASSLQRPDGSPFGIVIVNLDMRSIFAELTKQSPADRELYIVNTDGDYLLHPDPARTFGFDLGQDSKIQADFPGVSRLLESREPILTHERDAQSRTATLALSPINLAGKTRFWAVEAVTSSTFLSHLEKAGKKAVIAAVLICALATLMAFFIARTLVNPLKQITDAARALAEGKFTPLPVKAKGEVGELARAFSFMEQKTAVSKEQADSAQQEIQESHRKAVDQERRYRDLLAKAAMGFAEVDDNGRIINANEPYAAMVGYASPQDIIGRHFVDFLIPEERVKNLEYSRNKDAGSYPGVVRTTATYLHPDGKRVNVEVGTIRDVGSDGRLRILALCQDVTESLASQRRLMQAKSIFEGLFQNSEVAIVAYDLSKVFDFVEKAKQDGIADFRAHLQASERRLRELAGLIAVNDMNAAATNLFGEDAKTEMLSPGFFQVGLWPQQVLNIAESMFKAERNIRTDVEFTLDGKDAHKSLLYSCRLPQSHEDAKSVSVVIIDLTEIKSAEIARQANVAKSDFLASMSHEIRTPLNGVLGNLELLAQTQITTEQQELIESADKASKSLLALIGNILDFSKIEAGKLTVETGDFNPCAVMDDAIEVLQSIARQKGIFIAGYYADDVPTMARGDEARIRQILLNLIGNAVKFTERGGIQVRVTATMQENDICMLRYEVHDSGSGFDPANAEKLFDAFTQDRINRDVIKGTGLGLSICRKLVETFGGSIGCEGAIGKGGSFWFELPAPVVRASLPSQPVDLSEKRVLVISAQTTSDSFDHYFASRRARIVRATDKVSGLSAASEAAARGEPFDLCVLYAPPENTDWTDFVSTLRGYRTVPIIYLQELHPQRRRWALRQSFVYIISESKMGRHLDRNIRYLLGQTLTTKADAQEKIDYAARFSGLSGRNILILEDSLTNQAVISKQLRTFGMNFVIAADGQKGLDVLDQFDFDLILCDCSMPVMNGFEFTRAVRKRETEAGDGHHRIIVALTANAFREDEEKCIAAGMDDFMSKPVTLGRLGSVLSKWLGGTVTVSEPVQNGHKVNGRSAIDLAALTEILGTDDQELQLDLLSAFAANVATALENIKAAVAGKDVAKTVSAAHTAKGDARSMGATKLGEIYATLESDARANSTERFEELVSLASNEVRDVELFISSYQKEQKNGHAHG